MHISIWVPLGLDKREIAAIITGLFIERRRHPISIEHKPMAGVSVHISTCDFDPIARMPDIVEDIADAIYRAFDGAYDISCLAIGIPAAYRVRMAEAGAIN